MNGLSPVFDQIVSNSYLSGCVASGVSGSETIDSCGQQLAFESLADKALTDRIDSTDGLFDGNAFHGLTDADSCLNSYFCDQQLSHNWNQFNDNNIDIINDSFITSHELNAFDQSLDTNSDPKTNPVIDSNANSGKQNANKKSNNNSKKWSRKEPTAAAVRPPKPVSAYALFFRDAQSLIKSSNPSASFGEISKVVASHWEALDTTDKNIYKQRADHEKKNYLKTLASSRAQQIAGLMAESTAKLGSALMDNRLTNDTNRQNDKTNSFESTSQQMSTNKNAQTVGQSANDNQNFVDNSSQQLQQNLVSTSDQSASALPKQHCIRSGCDNDAIDSPEWDSEYCSSECCVKHCSDVFQAWVQKQQFPQSDG